MRSGLIQESLGLEGQFFEVRGKVAVCEESRTKLTPSDYSVTGSMKLQTISEWRQWLVFAQLVAHAKILINS